MATKSYSKHKEYKEYSTSGNTPYTGEAFDMMKSELIPKGSKLDSLGRNGVGTREYHYEYKEEKLPSGKYDRKDMRTVEEYTIPPKSTPKTSESSSYYYEKEEREIPSITKSGTRTYNYESASSTPGYTKVRSSKATKDMSHNVEELDSLLDDLQKDQERQLFKSGYTSDTAESSSFDYKRGTPIKAPSSGYSTLKREERLESSSWGSSPPPVSRSTELRQEMFREEKTESRVVPSQVSPAVPPAVCANCHHAPGTATLSRSSTPMNKVTTTVKTYTYEVPADQDPATLPLPAVADHQHSYVSSENLRSSSSTVPVAQVSGGCQYCSHCNSHARDYRLTTTTGTDEHKSRVVYGSPAAPLEPRNGHPPHGPQSYKYSETSYSSHNTTQRFPPSPSPSPGVSPSPFPAPAPSPTPTPTQQTPKRLDDLLAEFPEARFPTQPDGVVRRKVEVTHESQSQGANSAQGPGTPSNGPRTVSVSKNVAGPAVYYPPGHTLFAKKPESASYQASAMSGGGAYASGRGMYEYESGSKSKEKHSETKTAVPVCLPLCCAMPCVLL